MEKSKKRNLKRILFFGLMFVLAGGIALTGSLLYSKEAATLIRNTVMILAGTGIVIFAFTMEEINQRFIYRNDGKYARFAMMYLGGLIASVFLPYLPVTG